MDRFDTNDDRTPQFFCCGCGYAFWRVTEESVHACECGSDLCSECQQCAACEKLADKAEERRHAEYLDMIEKMRMQNTTYCVANELI